MPVLVRHGPGPAPPGAAPGGRAGEDARAGSGVGALRPSARGGRAAVAARRGRTAVTAPAARRRGAAPPARAVGPALTARCGGAAGTTLDRGAALAGRGRGTGRVGRSALAARYGRTVPPTPRHVKRLGALGRDPAPSARRGRVVRAVRRRRAAVAVRHRNAATPGPAGLCGGPARAARRGHVARAARRRSAVPPFLGGAPARGGVGRVVRRGRPLGLLGGSLLCQRALPMSRSAEGVATALETHSMPVPGITRRGKIHHATIWCVTRSQFFGNSCGSTSPALDGGPLGGYTHHAYCSPTGQAVWRGEAELVCPEPSRT
ncbi:hypothetical protein SCATT_23100 [Streptantibioticus cattleyicolor NRRL 8057 = DSM 46488]|uniref:Uncharacterized protein n=1 Tax=Streptantibioticus cattleyicolor (strain ATCC 35852 / DSM 46488 / JCM 4925 / NBRC 14057 / NRRL 8057) TaxID=1003195 RepID=G8WQE9_STREN|nr:hypothetical protein SCATT_23100 [Streptantibioticus cattleyicolor NRRL 8057 = DSM 46488]